MATQWKSQRLNMTIKSLDQIRTPVHKLRFPQVLVGTGILAMLVMRPAAVYALSCGDTITASTTLASDLGPCSGTALTIGASNVTLNLAGFSIIGPSTCGTGSIGVFVPGSSANDEIKGPGNITGFDQGIHLGTPGAPTVTQGTLVRHVHLTSNGCVGMGTGITMQGSSGNMIKHNHLSSNPCIGIFIDNGASNQMLGNAITGSNTPPTPGVCSTNLGGGGVAIEIHIGGGSIVNGNSINNNTNGVVSDGFSAGSILSGNDISSNTQDGVALSGQALIRGNHANANGRDGIAISEENGYVIRSNTTNSNGRYGVAVGGARGEAAGSNNVTEFNHAIGNAVFDLFWDGNGTGNCWERNIFDTSSPAPLPACL